MLKSQTTSPTSVTGGDAYGARAMQAFSEGDVEKAKEIQREEDKQSAKALVHGTSFVGGGLSSKLLTDIAVTGLSTAADTAMEGDFNNLGKNLTLNAGLDLLGHSVTKYLPKGINLTKIGLYNPRLLKDKDMTKQLLNAAETYGSSDKLHST